MHWKFHFPNVTFGMSLFHESGTMSTMVFANFTIIASSNFFKNYIIPDVYVHE